MSNEDTEVESGWVTLDLDSVGEGKEEEIIEVVAEGDEEAKEDVKEEIEEVNDKLADSEDSSDSQEAPEDKPKRKSRAQERIRQLVAEKKAEQENAARLQAELESLRAATAESQKSSYASQAELMEQSIKGMNKEYIAAMNDGDIERATEINNDLQDIKLNKRIIEAQAEKVEIPQQQEHVQQQQLPPQQEQVQIPEAMQDYLEENQWFLNPRSVRERMKQAAVVALGDELKMDGYDETETEFYTELNARLEKEFGKSGSNSVESEVQEENSSTHSQKAKVNKKKSVVSGASRTPASPRNRVSLSPSERALAKKFNIPEEKYALRKRSFESSEGGWVDVN